MLSASTFEMLRLGSDNHAALAVAAVAVLGAAAWIRTSSSSKQTVVVDGKQVHPRDIPYPPGTSLLFGNMVELARNSERFQSWLLDNCTLFDFQPWQMKVPGQPKFTIFSSPEAFDEICTKQFDHFEKGKYQREMISTFMGNSLAAADGERWYHQRKTVTKFFSARALRAYMSSAVRQNLEQVMDMIDNQRIKGESVNLTKIFHDFTMQTIVETGLGIKLDWIGRDEPHPFSLAIDEASELMAQRFTLPGFVWKMKRALNVGSEAKLAAHMDYVVSWLSDIVNKGLAAGVAKSEKQVTGDEPKSMLELFAEASREDADGIRPDDIVDFIQVIVIGARDSTAIALTWFFYEISRNPEVEAKIRDELNTSFPDRVGKKGTFFTADDARSLVYLEAAIKEVLRLHPPGPFIFKEVIEDSVVLEDVLLRKKELIGLSLYCTARNPKVWGEDASQFKPERWIDGSTGQLKPSAMSKFVSFSTGPRACVGMSLAMLELRVVALNLISRFHFDVDPSVDGSYGTAALLVMKQELIARVQVA